MKGITPIIAIIMLLMITIALVGFAYVFFSGTMESATNATSAQLEQQMNIMGENFVIEAVDKNTVIIRNTGIADLKNIKFYVHPEVKIPSKVWIFENPFKKIILRPDFFLPEYKIYVEYWGLIGDKNYDEKRKLKRKAYLENDIDFIDIYPDNLENIDWIFTQKLLDLIRSKEGNNTYKS